MLTAKSCDKNICLPQDDAIQNIFLPQGDSIKIYANHEFMWQEIHAYN